MQLCPRRAPQEGVSQGALEVEKTEKRGLEFLEEGRAPQSHRGGPRSDSGSKYKVAQCSGS